MGKCGVCILGAAVGFFVTSVRGARGVKDKCLIENLLGNARGFKGLVDILIPLLLHAISDLERV